MAIEITSWTDLDAVRENLGGEYILTRSLSSDDADYEGIGDNFNPIGDTSNKFTGIFDGNRHFICDLVISKANTSHIGLFVVVSGIVRNLRLADVNVNGKSSVGTIASAIDNGTVSSCSVEGGTVAISGDYTGYIGGAAAGLIDSSIMENCYTSVLVSRIGSNIHTVAGLVSWVGNGSEVRNSYALGNISVSGSYISIGGVVGMLYHATIINSYYSKGTITATHHGGLIGDATNVTITNCSWLISVGLYAIGNHYQLGGVIERLADYGFGTDEGTEANFYYRNHAVYDKEGVNEWEMPPWYWTEIDYPCFPTLIYSWTDLDAVRDDLGGIYLLCDNLSSADIDYGGTGDDFTPIGGIGNEFSGVFDGNTNSISGLIVNVINSESTEYVALFGVVTGEIKNLALLNCDITAENIHAADYSVLAGSICGELDGENALIKNCFSTGSVSSVGVGSRNAGGLVGYIFGSVENSYSTVSVSCAGFFVGGLSAYIITDHDGGYYGRVVNSFFSGTMASGGTYRGGFTGFYVRADISNCSWLTSVTTNAIAFDYDTLKPIPTLSQISAGTDESTASNFYLRSHLVYNYEGSGGWESPPWYWHRLRYPDFEEEAIVGPFVTFFRYF